MKLEPIGPSRVVFSVKSYDRCRAFYEGCLGLPVDREWDRPGHRGVVYDLGSTHLELIEGLRDPFNETAYICIPVDDVDALWSVLAKSASVDTPITTHNWGHRNFTIFDPAGVRLKFFSEISEDTNGK